MGNAPVFGRRGTAQAERFPRLTDLAPLESRSEDEDLASWRAARQADRQRRYWRSFLGWRGAALFCTIAGVGLQLAGHRALGSAMLLAGAGCGVMSFRRGEP